MNTTETNELIDGLAAVGAAIHRSLADDGKVSKWEILTGILPQYPLAAKALQGIQAVPHELLNAGEAAHDLLTARISNRLVEFGITARSRDIAAEWATWLLFTLRTVQKVRNLPVSAEEVTS